MSADLSGRSTGTGHDGVRAEFDQFAVSYDAGMQNVLKRLAAESADDFAEIRAEWLLRYMRRIGSERPHGSRLLDFGCGAATFLKALRRLNYVGELFGCDASSGMIQEARRTWKTGTLPDLVVQQGDRLPYRSLGFDIAVAGAVFHHIPRTERRRWFDELYRVLRPGGHCVIFEHNPWNLVTRWVVSRTPIDAKAILLSKREATAALREAGFEAISGAALLFFPPRFKFLRRVERWLARVPLGGQYVVVGRRSA